MICRPRLGITQSMPKPLNNEDIVLKAVQMKELEIDSNGRIWRLGARRWDRWKRIAVFHPCKRRRAENNAGKYLQIRTMIDGNRVHAMAHRLVFLSAKGQIPPGLTVNHCNGKAKDNRPENLELATYAEQIRHSRDVLGARRSKEGEANHQAKLREAGVREIRRRREAGESLKSIARDFGISNRTVSKIARGAIWKSLR